MPSIILSDNGVSSGSAGLKSTAASDGALSLQTTTAGGTATTAISIDTSQNVTFTNQPTYSGGTANGVAYLNGSKVLTTGSALTFDGTNLGIGTSSPATKLEASGVIRASSGTGQLNIGITGGIPYIQGYDSATAGNRQLAFYTGTEVMRLDSSGNLGLGVTPSAWGSSFKALQMSYATMMNSSAGGYYGANFYYNSSGNPTYVNNGYALAYSAYSAGGAHLWLTAPSGTAGNAITFTQAMTLDASGNLGVGSTSPNIGGLTRALTLNTPTAGNYSGLELAGAGTLSARFITNNVATYFGSQLSIPLIFETNATERARIDTGGKFLLGVTSGTGLSNSDFAMVNGGSIRFRNAANSAYLNMINVDSSNNLNFGVGGVPTIITFGIQGVGEAGRFDSSGNLLAGCTTTLNLTQSGNYLGNGTASYVGTGHANGTASGSNYTAYYYNAGYIGGITQNGTTAVAYNTTSDYRLKENVQPLSGALEKVAALKPCTYTWKSAPDEIGEGFIAHELAEVVPQCVTGEKDAVDADGNPVYQGIDTSFLVATLTAAIQEQQSIIQQLQADVAALKGAQA